MAVEQLFNLLWQDYIARLCPSAHQVQQLLQEDEALNNDHIALRTFNLAPVGIETLAKPFIALGYEVVGHYSFAAKKLDAIHLQHADLSLPKVFISELKVEQCSAELQDIVHRLVKQIDRSTLQSSAFLFAGRLWDLSFSDYQQLAQESEYAAWLAAHGYGANHFTVNVNQLQRLTSVEQVNQRLAESGFTINQSGGAVKGNPKVMLEQSSTMADMVSVRFQDGEQTIPGGFYEFAKRYPTAEGPLYQGFVTASADKIFESTHQ
ncbi:hypothetical protein VHP8226_00399 [Vibrio hippocampi]|uniref:2-oxoadipate dioxygenase/decarboxylase n=1 Tax=Vibrio hippocampi TaxID=654686 RepID=A0ABM8ZED8_9VIBR|nr:DUF1338 domain-containing protein [Vibrio hippocampi]CAH0524561.1 hypothetical protein VHP8226_00399 [Vibrio hippocampi]